MSVSRKGSNACFGNLLRLELRANPASEAIKSVAEYRDASNVGTKLLFQDEFVNIWEFRLEPHRGRVSQTQIKKEIRYFIDQIQERDPVFHRPDPKTIHPRATSPLKIEYSRVKPNMDSRNISNLHYMSLVFCR